MGSTTGKPHDFFLTIRRPATAGNNFGRLTKGGIIDALTEAKRVMYCKGLRAFGGRHARWRTGTAISDTK